MLPKKTALAAAGTMVMVIVTITTAIALNIGLLRSAQPADSGAPAVTTSAEPQVQTVVVELPADGAAPEVAEVLDESLGAPMQDQSAPVAPAARAAVPARAVVQAAAAASPATRPSTSQAAVPATKPSTTQAAVSAAPSSSTQSAKTQAPVTQAPVTQAPTTTAAPAVQTEYLTFPMGNVGEVVVANHGGQSLEFWAAYPSSGWRFMVEKRSGREIEIKFEKDGQEAKMQVKLEGGNVKVEREGL